MNIYTIAYENGCPQAPPNQMLPNAADSHRALLNDQPIAQPESGAEHCSPGSTDTLITLGMTEVPSSQHINSQPGTCYSWSN